MERSVRCQVGKAAGSREARWSEVSTSDAGGSGVVAAAAMRAERVTCVDRKSRESGSEDGFADLIWCSSTLASGSVLDLGRVE